MLRKCVAGAVFDKLRLRLLFLLKIGVVELPSQKTAIRTPFVPSRFNALMCNGNAKPLPLHEVLNFAGFWLQAKG
jgi:hypothetical protein